ncbi:hypothetical protein QL285_053668 [Trifolium repens]|nr:hypothetical protein QL285_053668 [Trifolium repens]
MQLIMFRRGLGCAHKEANWISSILWMMSLICLESITACIYVVWKLFQISCYDPAHFIFVKQRNIIRVIGMMQWMVLFCKLLLGSKIDSYFNYADRGLGPCPECLCKYLAPTKALLDLHRKKDRGLGPDA